MIRPIAGPTRASGPSLLASVRAVLTALALMLSCLAPAVAAESSTGQPLDGPGPHDVATLEVEVTRTRGGSGSFAARAYVPLMGADESGSASTPVVAFGHGYLADVDWYESTLVHLASWGIAVIAPRSGGGLIPDHGAFADDLRSALDWAVAASADADTWPGGPVDTGALAVSGHSMGGGAAVLAAARQPDIGDVATLAAAETRPSAIEAAARIDASALFLAGSDDAITPIGDHQRPMFEAMEAGRARLGTLVGGSHCGFLDTVPAVLGLVCDEGALDPDRQRRITRGILTAWLMESAGDRNLGDIGSVIGPEGAPLILWE